MKSVLTEACILKLQNFEGPFDLLFYLIEKNKMNIYEIEISQITDQYMEYLFAMQELDLEVASEFLVIASTLLHIKSRLLLPNEKNNDQDEVDLKEQLILSLMAYKKYKEFSIILREREQKWSEVYYKLPEPVVFDEQEDEIYDLCPIQLKKAYLNITNAFKEKMNDPSQKMSKIIQHEKVSLKAKMRDILNVLKSKATACFSEIFNIRQNTKLEIATGFLAMLELVKLKKAYVEQENCFDEIMISSSGDFDLDFSNEKLKDVEKEYEYGEEVG